MERYGPLTRGLNGYERIGSRGVTCAPCKRVVNACEGAGDDARCIDIDGGSVCGRGCSKDEECGPRFRCQATTSSGDFQCVPQARCETSPCKVDADCNGYVCRDGMCVGAPDPAPPDAGPTVGTDPVAPPAPAAPPGTGGCSSSSRGTGALAGLLLLLFLFKVRR